VNPISGTEADPSVPGDRPGFLALQQITLAAIDPPAMVAFYNAVLGSGLRPFRAGGAILWRGELGGLSLLLCPNEIAGVDARQARHQLLVSVPDLREARRLAIESGGAADDPVRSGGRETVILRDPDGNTLEVIEAV
jgi:catechol 2,3-dioxygenase-like lactoylglutathione lyase family enzyme